MVGLLRRRRDKVIPELAPGLKRIENRYRGLTIGQICKTVLHWYSPTTGSVPKQLERRGPTSGEC